MATANFSRSVSRNVSRILTGQFSRGVKRAVLYPITDYIGIFSKDVEVGAKYIGKDIDVIGIFSKDKEIGGIFKKISKGD